MNANFQIKVCGMRDPVNVQEVLQLTPDYVGLIFYPASPRYVGEVDPTLLSLRPETQRVGVFVNESIENILKQADRFDLDVIQLHGQETPTLCLAIKEAGFRVWKAFGIDSTFNWTQLHPYQDLIEAFLFDTKSPKHGGTGQSFDWQLLQNYPFQVPYYLSGGLNPENLKEACKIKDTRCLGLDLNSGFEVSPGLKSIPILKNTIEFIRHEQISSRS